MHTTLQSLHSSKLWSRRHFPCAFFLKDFTLMRLSSTVGGTGTEINTDASYSPVSKVRSKHQFEEPRLIEYLLTAGVLQQEYTNYTFSQFSHGQSNPTFILECDVTTTEGATSKKRIVIRKQPPGKLLKGS